MIVWGRSVRPGGGEDNVQMKVRRTCYCFGLPTIFWIEYGILKAGGPPKERHHDIGNAPNHCGSRQHPRARALDRLRAAVAGALGHREVREAAAAGRGIHAGAVEREAHGWSGG